MTDVTSEACFTAMTGDRHDELAAMVLSKIRIPSDTVMICMNFNSYASLVIFSSFMFFFSVLFLNTKLYIYIYVICRLGGPYGEKL